MKAAMLILARKTNETIMIGDNIKITVVEIRGDKVRLGIVAPENVKVDRKEIRTQKEKKNGLERSAS